MFYLSLKHVLLLAFHVVGFPLPCKQPQVPVFRFTPGALGYAQGREPDLGNLCCTLTLLEDGTWCTSP